MLDRRRFLATAAAPVLAAPARRPNIVLILADDLGYGDVGCFGQEKIATPNIDRLAREGMLFRGAYAGAAVCAPSRCCLMTGLDTGRALVRDNRSSKGQRVSLRPEDRTVAEVLKAAGYRTGLVGKWGIGEAGSAGIPNRKGFDTFFGYLNQDHALHHYPMHLWDNETEFFPDGNQGAWRKEWAHDLLTARALRFIDGNRAAPFFLYFAPIVPHADSERSRQTGNGYDVPGFGAYASRPWPDAEKGFAAMVDALDRSVGAILEKLQGHGLERDTLILFTSDNGPAKEGTHTPEFFRGAGGLRGMKGQLYEGGIRVPTVARWPARVAAGAVSDEPWAFWDFLPTAADAAGARAPRGLSGRSIVPVLTGQSGGAAPPLYWETYGRPFRQAVRHGQWKWIAAQGQPPELYDLAADPGETRNLAAAQPTRLKEMEEIARARHVPSGLYSPQRLPKERKPGQ